MKNKTTKRASNSPMDEQQILEAIQKRAYEIWEANGCQSGHDVANWIQAECEVRAMDDRETQRES